MAAGKRRKKNNMMSVLFIPPANMRHKNVKNEKKQKDFHKKRKNHLLYPQKNNHPNKAKDLLLLTNKETH